MYESLSTYFVDMAAKYVRKRSISYELQFRPLPMALHIRTDAVNRAGQAFLRQGQRIQLRPRLTPLRPVAIQDGHEALTVARL